MITPVNIPAPFPTPFTSGILHPELYLWDAWSFHTDTEVHLYCLALGRRSSVGESISPANRNNYPFHIRHFKSTDSGFSWVDLGCFQQPGMADDGHDERNIWSGSVLRLTDGRVVAAYTGIAAGDDRHPFIQSIGVGISQDGSRQQAIRLLLCPKRDRKILLECGYYLAADNDIGSVDGEEGGPILALRDPFLFFDRQGQLWMVWAAKQASKTPAMGIAHLRFESDGHLAINRLLPPVLMPDTTEYSQLEVPKIYFDSGSERYLLFVSTSTRESELQSESEVEKCMRVYMASNLDEVWQPAGRETSVIANVDNLFGMTVLAADAGSGKLICMAPYTEVAGDEKCLAFAPKFTLDTAALGDVDQLTANFESG